MSKDLTQKLNGSLEDKVDRLIVAVHSIGTRLESLETKVEQRLRQTQPIWEAVQSQLAEIRESQKGLVESQQSLVESQMSLVESQMSLVESQQGLVESQQRLADSQQRLVESHQRLADSQQRLAESQQRLAEEMRDLRAEVASLRAETEKGFRTFDRRMERQIGEFEKLHAYQRDLEDRVDRIEKITNP